MNKLEECVEILDSKRIPLSKKEREKLKKIYPYYGAQGIIDYVEEYIFDGEFILVAEDGENLKSLKQGIATWATGKFWVNNHAHILGKKEGVNLKYIFYLLNQLDITGLITGSAQPKLSQKNLSSLKLNIPDIKVQNLVANFLSMIDRKIEVNNQIIDNLSKLAKETYDYWFIQFDFPNEEGKPYKSSGGKMVWDSYIKREIPEGWDVKKIKDIESNIITGKTPSTKDESNFGKDIPFITIGDIRGKSFVTNTEISLSFSGANSQKNKFIPKHSLCVTCIATPGLIGITTKESQTNQQINSINCKYEQNLYYLFFAIKDYFKYSSGAKTGNTFLNMNKEDFSNIELVYNKNVIKQFYETVCGIFNQIEKNELCNQKLCELKDWILPLLMNGQVKIEQ